MNFTEAAQCTSEWLLCLLLFGSATLGHGQTAAKKTLSQDGTTLRVWGVGSTSHAPSPLLDILAKLEQDYRNHHPTVRFVNTLRGNDSALGGIYVGAADIALMDREPSYIELDGYQQVIKGQKPLMAAFMRGGIERRGHSSPLVVIVNRRNPIETLTVVQLRAIFNAADSVDRRARLWRDIGLKGAWADRPFRLYGFGVETSESRTFSKAVMGDSRRWPCSYREMPNTPTQGAAQKVVQAVANDPNAIGITTFDAISAETRVVAIQSSDQEASQPTRETLASGRYILVRSVFAVARGQQDAKVEASVHNFLSYLMTDRAQAVIEADGTYIPLAESALDFERRKLR